MVDPSTLRPFLETALESTNLEGFGERYKGKVRDVYTQSTEGRRILIATDRQSAFDELWCTIPLKGQVLNQLSAWWFEHIGDLLPTHLLDVPDPNVAVVRNLKMLPVEIVVRAYLTGSTETSAWVNYNKGVRNLCGVQLPDGLVRNQPFDVPILTPTTKGERDELISPQEIIERGLTTAAQWEQIADRAIAIFKRGQEIAASRGLILVDTKYEMGVDAEGNLTIADEVHTPDSSRYWVHASYANRFGRHEEPESLDKEFFRLWLKAEGYAPGKKKPVVTDDVRCALAAKYIDLYERMTGNTFILPSEKNTVERIAKNIEKYRIR